MAQKFIGLEDAAKQLGATKDQLNSLREAGELRAYRDGASWKFRTEDIEALAASGLPSGGAEPDAAASDSISLDDLGGGISSDSLDFSDDLSIDLSDIDLGDELEPGDAGAPATEAAGPQEQTLPASAAAAEPTPPPSPESDLELAAVDEPTVAAEPDEEPAASAPGEGDAGAGELELATDDGGDSGGDDGESILLTDASVGGSPDRPPSTIIGKSELAAGDDDDLELAPSGSHPSPMSDVKLASSDELEPAASAGDAASQFEGLEELEIDLEAESSRILEAEDLAAAQAAAKQKQKQEEEASSGVNALDSDMALMSGGSQDGASLTGLSSLVSDGGDEFDLAPDSALGGQPAEKKSPGSSSAVLSEDQDDDFVLGEAGSDVTATGAADSGINLAPADSGLALDDASLDLSGGGSSLDLSESFGAALTDGGPEDDSSVVSAEASDGQDFLLQPVGDDESDLDEDSSQIIALEEVADGEDDEVMISDDAAFGAAGFGAAAEAGAAPMGAPAPVEEAQFGVLTISLLCCSLLALAFCGMLSVDMIRTIWGWNEPYAINSGILDSLSGLMGLRN